MMSILLLQLPVTLTRWLHQGGGKCRFHQLLCTTNISAWFCHQMMAREINYFVNALLIVMAQADCKNHLLMTSFVTD
jgi:hypothetical protein